MYVKPDAPQSIGGVMDDAIRLYSATLSRCWPLSLALALVGGANGLGVLLAMRSQARLLGHMPQLWSSPRLIGLSIVSWVIYLIFYGGLLARQYELASGAPSGSNLSAAGTALQRLPGNVVGSILFGLAVGVSFVLLVVPGVYVWGRLQLWLVVVFAEDAGPTQALRTSWDLVQGHWWRTTTIIALAMIVYFVLALAAGFAIGVVVGLIHADPTERTIFTQIPSVLASVVLAPLLTAAWIAVYNDLKLRREGGDLAQRMGALGST
jgi:hypothetical protein